jgi:hypothetical protein
MGRRFWLFLALSCAATLPLLCQISPQPQVGTITGVKVHQQEVEQHASDTTQYDLSLNVGGTRYVVLYTPTAGSNTVEYTIGQNVLVLIGSKTITFTQLGATFEVPILYSEALPPRPVLDWSRLPSEYFSQKLQNLSDKLDLTADQQTKMKPIFEQEAGEARQIGTSRKTPRGSSPPCPRFSSEPSRTT